MIQNYIQAVNAKFVTGKTTEHSFRGDLQSLVESIIGSGYMVINEPKRQRCGAPDYIIEKNSIPIGFIEAKDIGDTDLEGKKKTGNKEQFDRYKASLNNRLLAKIKKRSTFCLFFIQIKKSCSTIMST